MPTATRHDADPTGTTADDAGTFRQRLLDGLADSIAADGYRRTTVADIVRRARTSRRTFYEHFSGKEDCFLALLAHANAEMVQHVAAAVDPDEPWQTQVRRAIEAWLRSAGAAPAIAVSWIRDVPALGTTGRDLQRNMMDSFVMMIRALSGTPQWRSASAGPVSRHLAVVLIGGLRELIATTVEDGGRITDIAEVAVQASIALLDPRTGARQARSGLPV